MTRQTFLEKAKPIRTYKWELERDSEYKYFIEHINDENYPIKNITKIDAFLNEFSAMSLRMKVENERDFKLIKIMLYSRGIIYLNENNVPAIHVADVWNSTNKINKFYMSEAGDFYNSEKIKIADNTDDFLEYILKMKCEGHEAISEETYQILRSFGWYEGRRIDISHSIEECEKRGAFFTDTQKEIISEFAGINGMDNYGYYYRFYSEEDNGFLRIEIIDGKEAVYLGYGCTLINMYLTGEGILMSGIGVQYGLDIMEGLQIMFNRNKNE